MFLEQNNKMKNMYFCSNEKKTCLTRPRRVRLHKMLLTVWRSSHCGMSQLSIEAYLHYNILIKYNVLKV